MIQDVSVKTVWGIVCSLLAAVRTLSPVCTAMDFVEKIVLWPYTGYWVVRVVANRVQVHAH